MKVWRLEADVDRFASFTTDTPWVFAHKDRFDGRSFRDDWEPPVLDSLDDTPLPMGDVLGFTLGLLLSARAVTVFQDLGVNNMEFLPVQWQGQEYYWANVLGTLDCLDKERSACLYSPTTPGRVLFVQRYVLKEEMLRDVLIFRVKDEPLRAGFVTEAVLDAIRKAGLRGFRYELVWDDSLPDPVKCSFDGIIKTEY